MPLFVTKSNKKRPCRAWRERGNEGYDNTIIGVNVTLQTTSSSDIEETDEDGNIVKTNQKTVSVQSFIVGDCFGK
ncbi:MAG: hypothetical protein ACJASR_002189 [Psychroserpens sp.]